MFDARNNSNDIVDVICSAYDKNFEDSSKLVYSLCKAYESNVYQHCIVTASYCKHGTFVGYGDHSVDNTDRIVPCPDYCYGYRNGILTYDDAMELEAKAHDQ